MFTDSSNYELIRLENPSKVLTSLLCEIIFITNETNKYFTASDYERVALDKLQQYAEKLLDYDCDELLSCWIDDFIKHCEKTINLIQISSSPETESLRQTTRDIRLFNAMMNEMIT